MVRASPEQDLKAKRRFHSLIFLLLLLLKEASVGRRFPQLCGGQTVSVVGFRWSGHPAE